MPRRQEHHRRRPRRPDPERLRDSALQPADFGQSQCPIDSQIGWVSVGIVADTPDTIEFPVTRKRCSIWCPHPGQAGLIGFIEPLLSNAPIFTEVEGRTEGDYGLEFTVNDINHVFDGVSVIEEIFWGVPADPANDPCGSSRSGARCTASTVGLRVKAVPTQTRR